MSYQVLARKWRPRAFPELMGQTHVVRALSNALDAGRLHHAFLFTGTRGVGKTTIARIVARCLNCERGVSASPCGECANCVAIDEGRFPDLIEVDAASRAKVDETRELMENVQFAPTVGRYKVYIIDEVHSFSDKSFQALLKTLEEPPPHVKFLLATTDPQKLPVTVLSRCLQFNLKRLPHEQIATQIAHILEAEGVAAEPPAVQAIARAADGSMRDALSLLDQAIAYGGGRLGEVETRAMLGTLDRRHVLAVLEALADGDAAALMACVARMDEDAPDYDDALAELLSALQRIAVVQAVPEAGGGGADEGERDAVLSGLAARVTAEDVQLWYQIGVLGRRDLPLAPDPRGGLEMILLRMLAFRPVTASDGTGGGAPRVTREAPAAARHAAPRPSAGRMAAAAPPVPDATTSSAQAPEAAAVSHHCGALDAAGWPVFLEGLALTGLARELASHCAFVSHAGGVLRLALASGHQPMNTSGVREKLEAALRDSLGAGLRLVIEVAEARGETPATRARQQREERRLAAVRAIEGDPQVRALCDAFGASVDPRMVRPLDP